MSTILYNANSSLVSRFQRKVKLRGDADYIPVDADCFDSSHEKNSREYLQELCQSVYPDSVSKRLSSLSYTKITVHAFFALVFKNFINSWFGTSIPSKDPELLCELYQVVERMTTHFEKHTFDWEQLILDDLPFTLSQHVNISNINGLTYNQEDVLLATSNYLCSLSNNDSRLEAAFLKSLSEDLLCGKILHSIADPYLILEVLNKMAQSLALPSKSNPKTIIHKIAFLKTLLSPRQFYKSTHSSRKPVVFRYVFTCFRRLISFERRRPLLYCICKYIQSIAAKWNAFDGTLHHVFRKFVVNKISSPRQAANFFVQLRQIIFPTDTTMGPPRTPLDDSQKQFLRLECETNLRHVMRLYSMDTIMGLTSRDAHNLVTAIAADQDLNTILLEKLLACVIAHAVSSNPSFREGHAVPTA
ncbi:LANO_0G08372g1_1 [Lachancea nothofagi CBS 11611]|uniref:LANO_0G08372g1_1 n=1 Tax=Lachancea nothofagi CBS 11611 TaxID=1266666 RepID=A0A1G4KI30_9SACH|nr:LANO_0G08372g1_1 [Lachancea nothofagi CBS 11611]